MNNIVFLVRVMKNIVDGLSNKKDCDMSK
jgi:hypothetical protein